MAVAVVLAACSCGVVGLVPASPTGHGQPSDAPHPSSGRTVAAVLAIIDGDPIEVAIADQGYKLRYIGIDTPEAGDPVGAEATAANRELVEGQAVYLEKDVSETDRYGRLLRYVYLTDGTFVNAELVRLGLARAREYPPDTEHHDLLAQMEQEARKAGRGIWGQTPTPAEGTQPARLPGGTAATLATMATADKRQRCVEMRNVAVLAEDVVGWVPVSEAELAPQGWQVHSPLNRYSWLYW